TTNIQKRPGTRGAYSKVLLASAPQKGAPRIEFTANVPQDGDYLIRISASSGKALHQLELSVDGVTADLESYPGLDSNEPATRELDPVPPITWYPGWHMRLRKGP